MGIKSRTQTKMGPPIPTGNKPVALAIMAATASAATISTQAQLQGYFADIKDPHIRSTIKDLMKLQNTEGPKVIYALLDANGDGSISGPEIDRASSVLFNFEAGIYP